MTKIITVQSQQRWEYCFESRRTEASLVVTLNDLGQQGWELVNTLCYKDLKGIVSWGAFLKRPSAGQAPPASQHTAAHSASSSPTEDKPAPLQGFDLSGDEFQLKTE
jgi:hypothetical protein